MSTQYDVKYMPSRITPRIGVILGSDVGGATAKDIANLPTAEKFFQSKEVGQFIAVSDEQRTVSGHPVSVAGYVVNKSSVHDGDIWHHTLYVK